MTLPEAEKLLGKYGIETVEEKTVKDRSSAVTIADQIGLPVVMKAAGFVHKTEHGAVKTNISTLESVRETFDHLQALQKVKGIKKSLSVLIQKQVEGLEFIIGIAENEQFGKLISFGLGGIFVEIFKDVSFRALPITNYDALDMISELKNHKILEGYRKIKPVNQKKLTRLILAVSEMAQKENIEEMDINPLFINGDSMLAADVRILIGDL